MVRPLVPGIAFEETLSVELLPSSWKEIKEKVLWDSAMAEKRKDKGDGGLDNHSKISDLLGEKAGGHQEC